MGRDDHAGVRAQGVLAACAASFRRTGHWPAIALFALAFASGGSATEHSWATALTQLLALVLIPWACSVLVVATPSAFRRYALAAMLLTAGAVAIQLLPVPAEWWRAIPAREALLADLRSAGVEPVRYRWSLSPHASERALWSMLPAMGLFLAALALPRSGLRILLVAIAAAATASLVLGLLQSALPHASLVHPYPRWSANASGLFANPNHHAAALAVGVVVVAALWLPWQGRPPRQRSWGMTLGMAGLAAMLFLAIMLTGSRAAFLLALTGVALVWLLLRPPRQPWWRAERRMGGRAGWILLAMAASAVAVSLAWLRFSAADAVRWELVAATAAMGLEHAPLGAGTGTFATWFDRMAPAGLVQWEYFNHAHNEYVQWWHEAGFAAVVALVGVAAIMLACFPGRRRAGMAGGSPGHRESVAAWTACVLLAMHSLVDYPLRTPALMAAGGLLAGVAVASRILRKRDDPEMPAPARPA